MTKKKMKLIPHSFFVSRLWNINFVAIKIKCSCVTSKVEITSMIHDICINRPIGRIMSKTVGKISHAKMYTK